MSFWGVFPNIALVEYRTKWIRIMRRPIAIRRFYEKFAIVQLTDQNVRVVWNLVPFNQTLLNQKWFMIYSLTFFFHCSHAGHSSLVNYLAQAMNVKNCPITFCCIFQLVWVPMTTPQNIRVCFPSFYLFIRFPPLDKDNSNVLKKPLWKKCFL